MALEELSDERRAASRRDDDESRVRSVMVETFILVVVEDGDDACSGVFSRKPRLEAVVVDERES